MDRSSENWQYAIERCSVPLCKLVDGWPESFGTGFLIDYRGKRLLLTAAHVVQRGETNWHALVDIAPEGGFELHCLGTGMIYCGNMTKGSKLLQDIDVCFMEMPNDFQAWSRPTSPHFTGAASLRTIFQIRDFQKPDATSAYGFAGRVQHDRGEREIWSNTRIFPNLCFVDMHQEFASFLLPVEHPGDDYFQGCSGAPVVDESLTPVALICRRGEFIENSIDAVALFAIQPHIDSYFALTDSVRV